LKQQNPQAAKQLVQQIGQLEQASGMGKPGAQNPSNSPASVPQSPPSNGQPPANGNGLAQKESLSINYKDAPPSIQRQMERAAGFQPATEPEANMMVPKPILAKQ
jgi:hypothetical protein